MQPAFATRWMKRCHQPLSALGDFVAAKAAVGTRRAAETRRAQAALRRVKRDMTRLLSRGRLAPASLTGAGPREPEYGIARSELIHGTYIEHRSLRRRE
jgi:hypothetical protein